MEEYNQSVYIDLLEKDMITLVKSGKGTVYEIQRTILKGGINTYQVIIFNKLALSTRIHVKQTSPNFGCYSYCKKIMDYPYIEGYRLCNRHFEKYDTSRPKKPILYYVSEKHLEALSKESIDSFICPCVIKETGKGNGGIIITGKQDTLETFLDKRNKYVHSKEVVKHQDYVEEWVVESVQNLFSLLPSGVYVHNGIQYEFTQFVIKLVHKLREGNTKKSFEDETSVENLLIGLSRYPDKNYIDVSHGKRKYTEEPIEAGIRELEEEFGVLIPAKYITSHITFYDNEMYIIDLDKINSGEKMFN